MTAPPRLNRLLCLESASLGPDGAGGVSRFWNELGWHWVDMRPGSAGEVAAPELRASRVSWTISLRAAAPGTAARPIPGQRLRRRQPHLRDPRGA